MPTYNYICHDCSNVTEITHSIDEVLKKCPHCGNEEALKKMPSQFNIDKYQQMATEKNNGNKPGEVVKNSIKELKSDLDAEREALKNRTFVPTQSK